MVLAEWNPLLILPFWHSLEGCNLLLPWCNVYLHLRTLSSFCTWISLVGFFQLNWRRCFKHVVSQFHLPLMVFLFLGWPFYTIAVKGGQPFCLFVCLFVFFVCLFVWENPTLLCLEGGKLIIHSHRFRSMVMFLWMFLKHWSTFCCGITLVEILLFLKKQLLDLKCLVKNGRSISGFPAK